MKTFQRYTATLVAGLALVAQAASAATRGTPIVHNFAIGILVLVVAAPTALGIAIALLGSPRDRWAHSAVRGGATGLGSILAVLLVLGVLIHVG
jgi:hypothetical protein